MTLSLLPAIASLLLAQAPEVVPSPGAEPSGLTATERAVLTLELNGFRAAKGSARIAIFRGADGYPEFARALEVIAAPVRAAQVVVSIPRLEPGEYAIAVFHDENDNGELDTNFIGMPKEGLGVSNDAKGSFGPPKFPAASFRLDDQPRRMAITMHYL